MSRPAHLAPSNNRIINATSSLLPFRQEELWIIRSTLGALLEAKRVIPIMVVVIPLCILQWRFSPDPLALPLGFAMCTAFVLIGPLSWRLLFHEVHSWGAYVFRLVVYASISLVTILTLGVLLPAALSMSPTLMTVPSSLLVVIALFLVGGWGLGRDIGLEANLAREKARADQMQREAERAQLLALRTHLDPHFLFNTLNAIAEWCREDGVIAEQAILQLSAMLRTMLGAVKMQGWPLQREIALGKDILALHLLRDDKLFTLRWAEPAEVQSILVPPMILLPLFENAVKHGPASGFRGEISIEIKILENTHPKDVSPQLLEVVIENPGPYKGPRSGSDGLPTVERRLALSYGPFASIKIEPVNNPSQPRTRVTITMPTTGPEGSSV